MNVNFISVSLNSNKQEMSKYSRHYSPMFSDPKIIKQFFSKVSLYRLVSYQKLITDIGVPVCVFWTYHLEKLLILRTTGIFIGS